MRRLVACAAATFAILAAVPIGLVMLVIIGVLITRPEIYGEGQRARTMINFFVAYGPPIGGSYDLNDRVIYLVLPHDGQPLEFWHMATDEACLRASMALWPDRLPPGWTIAVRFEDELLPFYSCTLYDPDAPVVRRTRPRGPFVPADDWGENWTIGLLQCCSILVPP